MGKWDAEHRTAGRVPSADERTRRAPARKDKRRWCRGKVGVEHQPAIRKGDNYTYARRVCEQWQPGKRWTRWLCCEQEYCTACGKILRHARRRLHPATDCRMIRQYVHTY